MPRPPAPLPDGLGVPFRTGEALAAGATAGRLRARDLARPYRGVRMLSPGAAEPDDRPLAIDRARRNDARARALAYLRVAPAGAFVAGRTAALLHGAPVALIGDLLDIAVTAPLRAPRGRGIRGRKVAPHLVSVHPLEGLPVASAASTWAMLARELSVRELVVLGDAFVAVPRGAGGRPLPELRRCTFTQLRSAADAGRRAGVDRLRDALELIREGAMSPPETELRLDLVAAGLGEPELDAEVRDASGRLLGITELVYREERIAIEVEGDQHRTSRAQWLRDLEKYADYAAAGWEVIRVSVPQVRADRAVAPISAALARARRHL